MGNIFSHSDYRDFLKSEFEERRRSNPSYSLRAFARDLCLGVSRLSLIFGGKQGLSGKRAMEISKRLSLNSSESDFFVTLVESKHARSRVQKSFAKKKMDSYSKVNPLTMDVFRVISDWYHFAILELIGINDFQPNVSWIAQRLNLHPLQVNEAVERLIRVEMLEISESGKWIDCAGFSGSPDGISSEAIKKSHIQLLEKAIQAIQTQSIDTRDFTSIVMAFDSSKILEAKAEIKKFRREFSKKCGNKDSLNKDSIYSLHVNLFRIDQEKSNEEFK